MKFLMACISSLLLSTILTTESVANFFVEATPLLADVVRFVMRMHKAIMARKRPP